MKNINKEYLWNKNFVLLLQGQLFSIFGDNIYDIALKVWMVVFAGIIVGICRCFFNPTINSILPDIVPKSKLLKANSVISLINTSDDMMGNALGGFIVQILGASISFLLNGISFLMSAIFEIFMRVPKIEIKSEKFNFFQDLKEGLLFVIKSKGLKHIYILNCFGICISKNLILSTNACWHGYSRATC